MKNESKSAYLNHEGSSVSRMSREVFEIAQKISEGHLKKLVITDDMVGCTVLHEGGLHLVGSAPNEAIENLNEGVPEPDSDGIDEGLDFSVHHDPSKFFHLDDVNLDDLIRDIEKGDDGGHMDPCSRSPLSCSGSKKKPYSRSAQEEIILRCLRLFPEDWIEIRDIANLIWEEEGYKSVESCKGTFYRPMRSLVERGVVEEQRVGRSVRFKLKSPE